MESSSRPTSNVNTTAMRTASYSKLNEWNGANNNVNSNGNVMTSRRSRLPRWKTLFVGIIVVLCIVVVGLGIGYGASKMGHRRNPKLRVGDTSATFEKAVVASQSSACAEIGRDMLVNGGSAVDAAIAALICEGAYSPQSAGLGGGFFMLIFRNDTKQMEVIDARETAPILASNDLYDADPKSIEQGALAVGVPGELRGYWMAHQRHGKLNWSQLFEPTIKICNETGVVVSKVVEYSLYDRVYDKIQNSPSMKSTFLNNATGNLFKAGEKIFFPELAETLRIIADNGAEEFYRGELAKKFIADIKALGGIMTLKDLEIYQPEVRVPVSFTLNDTKLFSVPPPGSGLILGFLLGILDGLNMDATDVDSEIAAHHLFIEASKFAYAKRPEIADPSFANLKNFTMLLTSPEFISRIRQAIDNQKTYDSTHYESAFLSKPDHGTVHVSVLAPNGDAVSATSTINLWFGACIRSSSTGIILNNEMDDFARPGVQNFYGIPPAQNNFIAPGKRPASSMTPAIVLDKEDNVRYVLGAAGGIKIISATAYSYFLHNWLGEDVAEAISRPRVHHQLYPNIVEFEKDFSQPLLDGLKRKGHRLEPMGWSAAANMIYRGPNDEITASGDPRRRSRPFGI